MKIGLVAGAMKPFHAGHDVLISESLSRCDHTIVFTTEKDRKGINGLSMARAWHKVILPHALKEGRDFEVRFVSSPIGAVYEFLDEYDDDTEFIIFQGTEDRDRFSPENLKKYAGHLNCISAAHTWPEIFDRMQSTEEYVKGEIVREAIESGNRSLFKTYLPLWLQPVSDSYFDLIAKK